MASDSIFRYRHGIAVAQVVIFSVTLFFGVYFKYAHRIGWFCIIAFSLFRLVGASCMLGTINNNSGGLWAGVFVCESLGMILLVFLLLEMLERLNKVILVIPKRIFFIPQIITWIDIGISIAGYVKVTRSEHPLAPTAYSQAGMALIAIMYLFIPIIFVVYWLHRADLTKEQRRILVCVAVCISLMAVRVIYSLIFVATGDMTFNAVKGSPTPYLLMTMLPEAGIIGFCIWTIMKIGPISEGQEIESRTQQDGQEEQSSHQTLLPVMQ